MHKNYFDVIKVKIYGGHIESALIYIGNNLCGQVPDVTIKDKWYEIMCKQTLRGNTIKVLLT